MYKKQQLQTQANILECTQMCKLPANIKLIQCYLSFIMQNTRTSHICNKLFKSWPLKNLAIPLCLVAKL